MVKVVYTKTNQDSLQAKQDNLKAKQDNFKAKQESPHELCYKAEVEYMYTEKNV